MTPVFRYVSILICFGSIAVLAACRNNSASTKPERRDITESVFASGVLEPEYVYHLTAQTDGILTETLVSEGDSVRAGQLLGLIDNKPNTISSASAQRLLGLAEINASESGPLLRQAEHQIALLKEKMEQDSVQWRRFSKLYETESTSKVELEKRRLEYESSLTAWRNAILNYNLQKQQAEQQAISQRAQKDITNVSASFNELRAIRPGKVYQRLKEPGDFVRRGELIAVIGDARRMRARLSVDENNIGKIKVGQQVLIRLNTDRDRVYKGTVTEILPAFDESNQSFVCRAAFGKQPDFTVSGTQLQANIITGEKKNALVIPRAYYNYNNQVLVKGKGPVTVQPGFISTEWVEVLEGIDEDDELTEP